MGFVLACLTAAYAGYRGSWWFVLTIIGSIAACIAAHFTVGFDPDWGATNLGLSIESSISISLLMMDNARAMTLQNKQLEYMLHMMEAMHAQMVAQSVARGNSTEVAQDARVGSEGR